MSSAGRAATGRLIDVELSIRGILRGFGLKVGAVTRKGFEARIRELVTGQATLERIAEAMLSARATLKAQYEKLHKAVLAIVREDAVCRRLMTVPGVGPVVAVTFNARPRRRGDRIAILFVAMHLVRFWHRAAYPGCPLSR
jgi:transposase